MSLIFFLLLFSSLQISKISSQEEEVITTDIPKLSMKAEVQYGEEDRITGYWLTTNSITISPYRFNAYLRDKTYTIKATRNFFGELNEEYGEVLRYEEILPGSYVWVFNFEKEGYQNHTVEKAVTINPRTFNIMVTAPKTLTQGENYTIETRVITNNGKLYEPWLSLEVHFTTVLEYDNDRIKTLEHDNMTDMYGVIITVLNSDVTFDLTKIVSFTAEITETETNYAAIGQLGFNKDPSVILRDKGTLETYFDFIKEHQLTLSVGTLGIVILLMLGYQIYKRRIRELKKQTTPDLYPTSTDD